MKIREAYRQLILRLVKLTPPSPNGIWQPWHLKLSDEAYQTWKRFQHEVEALMKEGGKLERLRDWGSKLPGGVARVAGLFHAVVEDLTQNVVIHDDTMKKAILVGTALTDHALAAFDLMESDPTIDDAQRILAWIKREGHQMFTLRECFCAHQRRFKRVAAVQPAITLLAEHAYLRRSPKPIVAHRPSESFEVNPLFLGER